MPARSIVTIVDDDESVRESLPDLLRELGFDVAAFASAEEFLLSNRLSTTQCLVLDIAMPGMTGPELQRELIRREKRIPIVFITAYGDRAGCLRVIKQGAADCLIKPVEEKVLLDAINGALGAA